jgi:serine/threonine-protein kinase
VQEPRNDSLIGALVDGRYLVESRVARGGMSTVYLALDRRLERRVALKVLYPHLAEDKSFLERFEQEAKSAARLSHPNVVGVLDQGVEDSGGHTTAYLVMEYVPGKTLRDLLTEHGRLSPRQALALMDPVIEGLAAAHEAGLAHRDIKPENVLLASSGSIKIADFGLARAVSASTGTATLVGTAAYISPELVTGAGADARSDIYSAGIVLFELLTGRQPFSGDTPLQVAFRHAYERVPAPSTALPGLAVDVDELVLWCTAPDPEERPVDGTALLGELRHIRTTLSDEELDYGPPAGTEHAGTEEAGGRPGGATEVLGRRTAESFPAGTYPTEAFSTEGLPNGRFSPASDATTVIGGADQHTRVFDAPPLQDSVPAPAPAGAQGWEDDGPARPVTARPQRKRSNRSLQRQQARAAQRPLRTLRGPHAGYRQAMVVVLLILLAVLAAAAGWLLGTGAAPLPAAAPPHAATAPDGPESAEARRAER